MSYYHLIPTKWFLHKSKWGTLRKSTVGTCIQSISAVTNLEEISNDWNERTAATVTSQRPIANQDKAWLRECHYVDTWANRATALTVAVNSSDQWQCTTDWEASLSFCMDEWCCDHSTPQLMIEKDHSPFFLSWSSLETSSKTNETAGCLFESSFQSNNWECDSIPDWKQ